MNNPNFINGDGSGESSRRARFKERAGRVAAVGLAASLGVVTYLGVTKTIELAEKYPDGISVTDMFNPLLGMGSDIGRVSDASYTSQVEDELRRYRGDSQIVIP
ncbi:hypothetical protein H6792_02050 [Candidatus Nomurabacteria bacterium]|nr:hypothetical protein [Candidatus Nomurabacteria bacterium]